MSKVVLTVPSLIPSKAEQFLQNSQKGLFTSLEKQIAKDKSRFEDTVRGGIAYGFSLDLTGKELPNKADTVLVIGPGQVTEEGFVNTLKGHLFCATPLKDLKGKGNSVKPVWSFPGITGQSKQLKKNTTKVKRLGNNDHDPIPSSLKKALKNRRLNVSASSNLKLTSELDLTNHYMRLNSELQKIEREVPLRRLEYLKNVLNQRDDLNTPTTILEKWENQEPAIIKLYYAEQEGNTTEYYRLLKEENQKAFNKYTDALSDWLFKESKARIEASNTKMTEEDWQFIQDNSRERAERLILQLTETIEPINVLLENPAELHAEGIIGSYEQELMSAPHRSKVTLDNLENIAQITLKHFTALVSSGERPQDLGFSLQPTNPVNNLTNLADWILKLNDSEKKQLILSPQDILVIAKPFYENHQDIVITKGKSIDHHSKRVDELKAQIQNLQNEIDFANLQEAENTLSEPEKAEREAKKKEQAKLIIEQKRQEKAFCDKLADPSWDDDGNHTILGLRGITFVDSGGRLINDSSELAGRILRREIQSLSRSKENTDANMAACLTKMKSYLEGQGYNNDEINQLETIYSRSLKYYGKGYIHENSQGQKTTLGGHAQISFSASEILNLTHGSPIAGNMEDCIRAIANNQRLSSEGVKLALKDFTPSQILRLRADFQARTGTDLLTFEPEVAVYGETGEERRPTQPYSIQEPSHFIDSVELDGQPIPITEINELIGRTSRGNSEIEINGQLHSIDELVSLIESPIQANRVVIRDRNGNFSELTGKYAKETEETSTSPASSPLNHTFARSLGSAIELYERKQKQNAVEELYAQAIKLSEEGKLKESINLLNEAIKLDPNNHALHISLGRILVRSNPDQAIKSIEKAIELDPSRGLYWGFLAKVYSDIQNWDKVIEIGELYEQQGHSPNVHILNLIAYAHGQKNDDNKSIEYYTKALAVDPNYAPTLRSLGYIYGKQEKRAESIHYYEKAIAIDPSHVEAWRNLGASYHIQNNIDKATDAFVRAITLDPQILSDANWVERHLKPLAITLKDRALKGHKQNLNQAISDLENANILLSDDLGFILVLGHYYSLNNQWEKAASSYEKFFGHDEHKPFLGVFHNQPYLSVARAYQRIAGKEAEAAKYLAQYIEASGIKNDPVLNNELTFSYIKANQLDKAKSFTIGLIEQNKDIAAMISLSSNVATAYIEWGRKAEAIKLMKQSNSLLRNLAQDIKNHKLIEFTKEGNAPQTVNDFIKAIDTKIQETENEIRSEGQIIKTIVDDLSQRIPLTERNIQPPSIITPSKEARLESLDQAKENASHLINICDKAIRSVLNSKEVDPFDIQELINRIYLIQSINNCWNGYPTHTAILHEFVVWRNDSNNFKSMGYENRKDFNSRQAHTILKSLGIERSLEEINKDIDIDATLSTMLKQSSSGEALYTAIFNSDLKAKLLDKETFLSLLCIYQTEYEISLKAVNEFKEKPFLAGLLDQAKDSNEETKQQIIAIAEQQINNISSTPDELALAHYAKGFLLESLKNYTEAKNSLTECLKTKDNPFYTKALKKLIAVCTERSEYDEAIQKATELFDITKDYSSLITRAWTKFLQAGDNLSQANVQSIKKDLEEVYENNQKLFEGHFQLFENESKTKKVPIEKNKWLQILSAIKKKNSTVKNKKGFG